LSDRPRSLSTGRPASGVRSVTWLWVSLMLARTCRSASGARSLTSLLREVEARQVRQVLQAPDLRIRAGHGSARALLEPALVGRGRHCGIAVAGQRPHVRPARCATPFDRAGRPSRGRRRPRFGSGNASARSTCGPTTSQPPRRRPRRQRRRATTRHGLHPAARRFGAPTTVRRVVRRHAHRRVEQRRRPRRREPAQHRDEPPAGRRAPGRSQPRRPADRSSRNRAAAPTGRDKRQGSREVPEVSTTRSARARRGTPGPEHRGARQRECDPDRDPTERARARRLDMARTRRLIGKSLVAMKVAAPTSTQPAPGETQPAATHSPPTFAAGPGGRGQRERTGSSPNASPARPSGA